MEREFFNERNCFQHDAKPENLACHCLSLIISFIQSNKGHLAGFLCCLNRSHPPGQMMPFLDYQLKLKQNNTIFVVK